MNATAFVHLLTWWIETLADALLRGIWIRYHNASPARAEVIFRRFVRLVNNHNWAPCLISFWVQDQLLISAWPSHAEYDDYAFGEEAFA